MGEIMLFLTSYVIYSSILLNSYSSRAYSLSSFAYYMKQHTTQKFQPRGIIVIFYNIHAVMELTPEKFLE